MTPIGLPLDTQASSDSKIHTQRNTDYYKIEYQTHSNYFRMLIKYHSIN